jgi:L-ribulose-5-phosphate 3-epimerase
MTRREVVCALALSGARLCLARERLDMSRFSALTDEIARTPADAMAFCRQYGLIHVELRGIPGQPGSYESMSEDDLKNSARELHDAGIGVSFLDAGLCKFSLPGTQPLFRAPEAPEARRSRLKRDGELFDRRVELVNRALRVAKILGTDQVRVFAFKRVAEPLKILPRVAKILEPMVDAAKRESIRLLVENEPSCNVASCGELAAIMRLLPSKWIGINWDVHNSVDRETPYPDGYRLLPKRRIHNVHIKARSMLPEFTPPNRLDWQAIFHAMLRDGYQGCFGLETHIFGSEQIRRSHECMREIQGLIAQAQTRT